MGILLHLVTMAEYTDKSFADVFPNMEKEKLYYVDGEAYKISEVEDNIQYEENHLPKQSQK